MVLFGVMVLFAARFESQQLDGWVGDMNARSGPAPSSIAGLSRTEIEPLLFISIVRVLPTVFGVAD